jgi:hypothetical protein
MLKKFLQIIIVIALSTNTVFASESTFTIYPTYPTENSTWIVRDVNPNQNYKEYLTLENLSNESIQINLAFHKTSGTKENITIQEETNPGEEAPWIKPGANQVNLAPHAKKNIEINIAVPTNITNGQYQGAIMATLSPNKGEGLQISTRIGSRIYLNITTNQELQANTLAPPNNSLHILLIVLSLMGIAFGTFPLRLTSHKVKHE